jgi:hypothetical protein
MSRIGGYFSPICLCHWSLKMALFIKKKKKSLKNGTQMFNGIP